MNGFNPLAAPLAIADELESIADECKKSSVRIDIFGADSDLAACELARLRKTVSQSLDTIQRIQRDLQEAMQ